VTRVVSTCVPSVNIIARVNFFAHAAQTLGFSTQAQNMCGAAFNQS